MNMDPGRPHTERIWEQRRALGRRLASLRSRSGFSQWEFAPLTGYSRSTLSDAELGRHRLRREFWERCDEALMSDGVLTAAYDRIEAVAVAVRRTARSQAQAAREEQASRRLQALLPAPRAEGLGAGDGAPGQAAPGQAAPGGTATNGITWGLTGPAGPLGAAPAAAVPAAAAPPAPRVAPAAPRVAPAGGAADGGAPDGGAADGGAADGGAPDGFLPPGPASPRAAGKPETAAQPHGAAATPLTVEECPHCHQPVTVIIVPAAPPAAGSSAG